MSSPDTPPSQVGAVVIGRNEGDRLVRCLASMREQTGRIVYVDSGSTDGSVAAANAAGAEVVELDLSKPFTAARARNAGFAALQAKGQVPDYVQFVDGDCELQPGWIAAAQEFLAARPRAAVACGRRRERFPETSVYNRLCDWEWDTPIGEAASCGGDALVRASAIAEVRGYNPAMIAGEEPELCVRLRKRGWKIWRLDREMTLHDAAMARFGQWFKRTRRAGHAFAEGAALHGASSERHGVAGTARALFWGLGIPLLALWLGLLHPAGFLILMVYPVQIARLALRYGATRRTAWERAVFTTLGKFPEMLGVLDYALGRAMRRPSELIEYK